MKILIVEDNPDVMLLVSDILTGENYNVLQAEDAVIGIEIAKKELPSLIIMDIQLPKLNGIEATRILKNCSETGHIKILAMTAFASEEDKKGVQAAGCDGYISKPIKLKEFLDTVRTLSGI